MDIVIIEDQAIIADSIKNDFLDCSNGMLSVTILSSIEQIVLFDFSKTKYIISDLFLGTSIYETLSALYEVKSQFPDISISIFTQSTEVNLLDALLAVINVDHLFCKRFDRHIADTVLNAPAQKFTAKKQDMGRAARLLNLDSNAISIMHKLASNSNVTSIALENNRSKSSISQILRKTEMCVGAKEKIMRLFHRD